MSTNHSIAALLARQTGGAPRELQVDVAPLTGGLVSPSVQAVSARYRDHRGVPRRAALVVKQLDGPARREAAIYQALMSSAARQVAPTLLGVERREDGVLQLFLQLITPKSRWPWRDEAAVSSVLHTVAALHESHADSTLMAHATDWDYELELQTQAARLICCLESHRAALRAAGVDLRLAVVRRLASRLSTLRQQLLAAVPLPPTFIHGDLHPGNVMILKRARGENDGAEHKPILLDWGRARLGSPLEDVSSWLQSLGYWEPVARRRHDTLLGVYLRARGLESAPTRKLRDAYWVAAASNCFAGSLEYHVGIATSSEVGSDERSAASRAVRDQLRILRRADACSS